MKKIVLLILCIISTSTFAQQLEVHFNKDLAQQKEILNSWGIGAALNLDQTVKKMAFKLTFDYSSYKLKDSYTMIDTFRVTESGKNTHFKVGIAPLYNYITKKGKLSFQAGVDISYHNFKYNLKYEEPQLFDGGTQTIIHYGHYIGVGAYLGLQYQISPAFYFNLQCLPAYLIPLQAKTTQREVPSMYEKGMYITQLQIGISVRINRDEN